MKMQLVDGTVLEGTAAELKEFYTPGHVERPEPAPEAPKKKKQMGKLTAEEKLERRREYQRRWLEKKKKSAEPEEKNIFKRLNKGEIELAELRQRYQEFTREHGDIPKCLGCGTDIIELKNAQEENGEWRHRKCGSCRRSRKFRDD